MPGTINFASYPTPLDGQAVPIAVCRYDDQQPTGQRYTLLPHVRCHGITFREGAEPSTARFSYVFDDSDPTSGWPTQFDDVWPITAKGPYVVVADDRLVVMGFTDQGTRRLLFDGFAQVPQVDLSAGGQDVSFVALGTPIRLWDTPIGGAFIRDGDDPDDTDIAHRIETDLPTRFNPDGHANCTPDEKDYGADAAHNYPVFLDPALDRAPDPQPQTKWTLGKFVRYILATWNEEEQYVGNGDFTNLDKFLKARVPKKGSDFVDPNDPATYDEVVVEIRDYDATNKPWPEAIAEQLAYAGFAFKFALDQDEDDQPVNKFFIYRKDAAGPQAPLDLFLQPRLDVLDPGKTNVGELHVVRESRDLVNDFAIEADPNRYEASFVLAPGFVPASGDESDANLKKWLMSALTDASGDDRAKYRLYVFDEAGDGHWDAEATMYVVGEATSLDDVLGKPDDNGPVYAQRLRPGDGTLITQDSLKKSRKAQLHISRDYEGPVPAVWDGTGTWQPISGGGWQLLKDRLGIAITAENVEKWDIGVYRGTATPQNPGRAVSGVTSQANPGTDDQTALFHLLLTCVIEGDLHLTAEAPMRAASPVKFSRHRREDAKDHFRLETVVKNSWYNHAAGAKDKTARDDTKAATAWAKALRAAHESPPVAGTVVIPWLANGYRIGDRIKSINGRGISFEGGVGVGTQGEGSHFPYIVSRTWDFSGDSQRTVLEFTDRRGEVERPWGRHG